MFVDVLWFCRGVGLLINILGVFCIFDFVVWVGICGDWFLGFSLEVVVLSGMVFVEYVSFLFYKFELFYC